MQEETEQSNNTETLNQEKTDENQISKSNEDTNNDNALDQDKQKKNEKKKVKDSNTNESKKEKSKESKESKAKNTQDKTKETAPDKNKETTSEPKEKKQKRVVKEIIGLNTKKDVIVVFKDSKSPEIVKMDEMKSNYPRDLLTFYESKFQLVDNDNENAK